MEIILVEYGFTNAFEIPFFRCNFIVRKGFGNFLGLIPNHVLDGWFQAFPIQGFAALSVNDFTLLVHHIIIFDKVFTNIKIVRFHLGLSILNGPADQIVLNRLAFLHAQPLHDAGHSLAPEYPQQIVFQSQIESG